MFLLLLIEITTTTSQNKLGLVEVSGGVEPLLSDNRPALRVVIQEARLVKSWLITFMMAGYGEKKSSFFLVRGATKRNQREVGEFPKNFKSLYVYHLAKAGLRQAGPRMGLSGQDSVQAGTI